MIYMSWNGFCMIQVSEQLPDGRTREQKLELGRYDEMTRDPPKIEKNKLVLKCILGHTQCI